jgi:hypothetical protein
MLAILHHQCAVAKTCSQGEEIAIALSAPEKQPLWMAIQPFTQDRVVAGGDGVARYRLALP